MEILVRLIHQMDYLLGAIVRGGGGGGGGIGVWAGHL